MLPWIGEDETTIMSQSENGSFFETSSKNGNIIEYPFGNMPARHTPNVKMWIIPFMWKAAKDALSIDAEIDPNRLNQSALSSDEVNLTLSCALWVTGEVLVIRVI